MVRFDTVAVCLLGQPGAELAGARSVITPLLRLSTRGSTAPRRPPRSHRDQLGEPTGGRRTRAGTRPVTRNRPRHDGRGRRRMTTVSGACRVIVPTHRHRPPADGAAAATDRRRWPAARGRRPPISRIVILRKAAKRAAIGRIWARAIIGQSGGQPVPRGRPCRRR